jgi:GNAT superfamily N-acetyltransferase
MNHRISTITFDEVLPIWKQLWPNRTSPIEPNSAMCHLGGFDMYNMQTTPTFFAYTVDDKIVGVNSGHMCKHMQYRSRGLYVDPAYRGLHIARKLLFKTIEQGKKENAEMCWSYPRKESWMAYSKVGFYLDSNFSQSETGLNAYCSMKI